LPHTFQQGKTFSLEFGNGNFFHDLHFDYLIVSWSEMMVIKEYYERSIGLGIVAFCETNPISCLF
jgi:hypothetical protein